MTIVAKEDNAEAQNKESWALINQDIQARLKAKVTDPSVSIPNTTTPSLVPTGKDVKTLEGEGEMEGGRRSHECRLENEALKGRNSEEERRSLGNMLKTLNYSSAWRRLSELDQLRYYAYAIQTLGEPILFSLLFTNETRRRMKAAECSERDYIAQRIRRRLKGVPFFFVIERAPASGMLHVHGALSRTYQTEDEIRSALKSVCGDPNKARTKNDRIFIHTRASHIMPPDWTKHFNGMHGIFGWSNYCAKDLDETAKLLELEGSLISRTKSVTDQSIATYETLRVFHGSLRLCPF